MKIGPARIVALVAGIGLVALVLGPPANAGTLKFKNNRFVVNKSFGGVKVGGDLGKAVPTISPPAGCTAEIGFSHYPWDPAPPGLHSGAANCEAGNPNPGEGIFLQLRGEFTGPRELLAPFGNSGLGPDDLSPEDLLELLSVYPSPDHFCRVSVPDSWSYALCPEEIRDQFAGWIARREIEGTVTKFWLAAPLVSLSPKQGAKYGYPKVLSRVKTSRGIGIGSTKKAMRKAYGSKMKRVRIAGKLPQPASSFIVKGRGKWETRFDFHKSRLTQLRFVPKSR